MLKVGLTGSIAVGKSFVCEVLSEQGCIVMDADRAAREVVEPGTVGLRRVVDEFGSAVLASDGSLNREKLGRIIFSDPAKRQLLNSLLHPLIIDLQDDWLKRQEAVYPAGIAVIDAALMIESGSYKRFDELVVVWCESNIQLNRLMKRDGIGRKEARQRIESQLPQEEKKGYATYLIDTSGGFEETRENTLEVLEILRRKARA
ncbi:MAG: dephospho-CoA kinase [Acidobacteriota bacterium]|nr:dephospho-CoA kinase [Acidobacteriota bacterium]MDH3528226.1 dephospho-CoA kinase [Acidobacteriota bacterium]